MSFLWRNGEISRENGKFVTTVYRKPTFSGVYPFQDDKFSTESFLPPTHKFGILYTLVCKCFTLYSDWSKFHRELVTLKEIFRRNGYPKLFTDNKCFDPISTSLFGSPVSLRGEVKLHPLVFSRSACPIHFKHILPTISTSKKSKWYPRLCDVFDDVIIIPEN